MLSKFKITKLGLKKNFEGWPHQNPFLIILISLLMIFSSSIFASTLGGDEDQFPNNTTSESQDTQTKSQKLQVLENPALVGSVYIGNAYDVVVIGDYAYVAGGDGGLKIVNVEDPENPVSVSSLDTDGTAWGVAVVGSYAYVADYDKGFKIIDIATPSTPSLTGSLNTDGLAYRVVVVDYAYVTVVSAGLKIINITTPSAPSLVGGLKTDGDAYGIKRKGDYAYVADWYKGLKVIDITNPAIPVLVGSLAIGDRAIEIAVVENYAYVANHGAGLKIINISNPSMPVLVGSRDTDGQAMSVKIVDDYAYVADYDKGLKIINVATPSTPFLFSICETHSQAVGVAIKGNYAYVAANGSGLKICRVKDHPPVVNDLYKSVATGTTITFTAKNFTDKYSDVDNDDLTKIKITSLPNGGTLKLAGTVVTVNQEIDAKYLDVLTFEPDQKWHGKTSFEWKGFDGYLYSDDTANVNMLVDNPPVVSDMSRSGHKNEPLAFSLTDLTNEFTDPDGDNLAKTQIISLPSNGVLKLSEKPVVVEQEIDADNLNYLAFDPNSNWHGESSFSWKGYDGFEYSTSSADVNMFIDEPPIVSNLYKSVIRGETMIFTAKDFSDKFSDAEGTDLTEVKVISLPNPNEGTLKLAGAAVVVDQEIDVKYLDDLTFERIFLQLNDVNSAGNP